MQLRKLIHVAFVIGLLQIGTAVGQESDSPEKQLGQAPPAIADSFSSHLDWAINRADLEIRRLKNMFFGRKLRWFVGRYWIDDADSLIDRRHCRIGIWGIDASENALRIDGDRGSRR